MKKMHGVAMVTIALLLLGGARTSWALSAETAMLLDLLKAKGVITENEAAEFTRTLEARAAAATATAAEAADPHLHSVQSLSDREEKREEKSSEGIEEAKSGEGLAGVASKISLSGLLEAALTSSRGTDSAGVTNSTSDLSLATAQLSADAFLSHYVSGHLALLYEEDPADPGNNEVTLDEALVGIKGSEACPTYVNIGRLYVPFGHFESHFISDPATLTLGETNDTAMVGGYVDDIFDLGLGVFKGKVLEEGENEQINSLVASAIVTLPQGEDGELLLRGGLSYLSNLASSDGLEPHAADDMDGDDTTTITTPGEVANRVGGLSAFVSLAYADRFFFDAEYLGALDDFADGDLSFVNDQNRQPRAWNLEAAVRVLDRAELALRYGGSDEAGTFLADDEYGAVLLYDVFDNTSLALEYLSQDFQDTSKNRQATMQLAVEF